MSFELPPIPPKRYFTIGEVSELCGVKAHVLRYWEQEFTQLKPVKRRGNRRYYQHHEVLLIRRIRELLYDRGFTISGARIQLNEHGHSRGNGVGNGTAANGAVVAVAALDDAKGRKAGASTSVSPKLPLNTTTDVKAELKAIRDSLLS
jgi:DNA-binding transcriptional MerR regulator